MAPKQDFAEQLTQQIKVWQAQIQQYQTYLSKAATQARADYEKGIAELRTNVEKAGYLLAKVQHADEASWKDMQAASQRAFAQLQKGWVDALARFM